MYDIHVYSTHCALMHIVHHTHRHTLCIASLGVSHLRSSRSASIVGEGARCDKGRQSYIFWIKEGTRHDRAGGAKLYILDKCQNLSPALRSGSILRRTDCLPAQGHCSRQISVNCSFVATIYFGVFYLSSSEGSPLSYESVLYLR